MVRIKHARPTTGSKAPTVVQGSGADTLQDSNPLCLQKKNQTKMNRVFRKLPKKSNNLLLFISTKYTTLIWNLLLLHYWEICS